jgi:hypothetical protein
MWTDSGLRASACASSVATLYPATALETTSCISGKVGSRVFLRIQGTVTSALKGKKRRLTYPVLLLILVLVTCTIKAVVHLG